MAGIFYPGGRAPSSGTGRETVLLSGSPFSTLAALETYSQANPTELLNNSSQVSLAVVTGDPTPENNGTFEWSGANQTYAAGLWVRFSGLDAADVKSLYESNSNTNAFTDADNTTVSMTQALTPNSIPIATTGGLVNGPIRDMGDRLMIDKDTQFPAGSLLLDDILRVSEQTGFIGITNNVTNDQFTVIDGRHNRTTGSFRPNQFFLTAGQSQQVLQSDDSVQITAAEFSFNYTSTLQGQTNIVEFKTYAALTNVRLRVTDTVSGVPFKHIPNRAAWDSETGGINFPTTGDNEYDLGGSELRLSPGREITIEVKADQAGFLGANQTTPYFAVQFQPAEFRGLAFDSQLNPLFNSVTLNQGKITFGNVDGSTDTISSATLDRVFRDFGQGNSGGVITTNSVAGAYYEISDDAKNASAFNITDSLDNDVYFNMDLAKVTEDLTLTITQANSEFSDGTTSLTLRHNHVLIAFCQRDVPTAAPSPTNPNVVYTMQVAVSGSAGPAITPDFENTVIVGANGDDSLDGANFHAMVKTMGRALTLAGSFPTGEHKLIYSVGENSFGNFVNDNSTGNVPNLNVYTPFSTYGSIDLADHATSIVCRRATGGMTIGDQCKVNVDGVVGNTNPSLILFNAELHEATEFKCQRLEATAAFDFSSASSGSHIRIEVDRYDGTDAQLNNMLATIPSGVTVTGWIGDYNFTSVERSKIINLTGSYTAQASDFQDATHVFYRFNNSGQVTFTIPVSVVPNNVTFSVKEVGVGGATHRVLVSAQGGTIDGSTDHLLDQEEAITIHKSSSTNMDIVGDYEFSNNDNNFVTGGSFANNLISLTRSGLSSAFVPLDLNDVNNEVTGLPLVQSISLTGQATTRQTLNLGQLALDWSALSGGKIGLRYYIQTNSQSGFAPDWQSITLDYGSGALVLPFNLNNTVVDGEAVLEVTIPDADYSSVLNVDPTVTIVVDMRGASWSGTFTFIDLYNRELSLIHNDVELIAEAVAQQEIGDIPQRLTNDETRIQNNRDTLNQLKQIIDNLPAQIPASVLSWLINDVSITDVATPVLNPTPYNVELSGDSTQAVFIDANQTSGTNLTAGTMASATTRGQKLLELAQPYSASSVIVHAYDGVSVTTNLVQRINDDLMAIRFVPAIPPGSYTETVRPTPANQVVHDWYDVPGHTPSFAPEADELFFTRNIPDTATTLTINYRYFANGAAGPTISATLANVGGSSNQQYQANLSLPNGGSFHIVVDYLADSGQIRYEAIPTAGAGLFIFDTQVNLSWTRTVTTPGTPATTENVRIGTLTDNQPPIVAFGPSIARTDGNAATMVIYGPDGQVDTGYEYNTLFGNADGGHLAALNTSETQGWYDWTKFTPNTTLLTEFVQRFSQPYAGWFTQDYNHQTVAEFGTQLQVKDDDDNDVKAGSELILKSPNGTYYQLTVANDGTLTTTVVP